MSLGKPSRLNAIKYYIAISIRLKIDNFSSYIKEYFDLNNGYLSKFIGLVNKYLVWLGCCVKIAEIVAR